MSPDSGQRESSTYERIAIALIWAGMIIILITTILFTLESTLHFLNIHYGQYGEFIGGMVGSLWALAGVILFYEALRFQRTELKMQRHELELQRHEIVEQTYQFKKQNETLEIQTFENTYFKLLSLHNEILESIVMEIKTGDKDKTHTYREIRGRDCFHEYYQRYKKVFHWAFEEQSKAGFDESTLKRIIEYSYKIFYEEYQADLGHYFRNLFTIFKFVDSAKGNPRFYINLIQSLLSNFELLLLYFHCLSDINPEFKRLVEDYSLFYKIIEDELIEITKSLYLDKAFEMPVSEHDEV